MDKREIDLLEALNAEKTPTQRELANQTGMSLGMVNNLIKKCARKGLLKIEKASGRHIKYNLTPQGLKKISERSLNYIKRSYQAIKVLTSTLLEQVEIDLEAERDIYLYGAKDEVYELIRTILDDNNIEHQLITDLADFKENTSSTDTVIYFWDFQYYEKLEETGSRIFNVVG